MKKTIAAIAIALALTACGSTTDPVKIAADVTPAVLSAEQVTTMKSVCQDAAPLLAIAASPGMPAQVHDTAVYPQAYCAELAGGSLPATTDANTPSWLPDTIAAAKIAMQVAGIVVPLVL